VILETLEQVIFTRFVEWFYITWPIVGVMSSASGGDGGESVGRFESLKI